MTQKTMEWKRINKPLNVNYDYFAHRFSPNVPFEGLARFDCDVRYDLYRRFRGLVIPFVFDGKDIKYCPVESIEVERDINNRFKKIKIHPDFKEFGEDLNKKRQDLLEAILKKVSPIFIEDINNNPLPFYILNSSRIIKSGKMSHHFSLGKSRELNPIKYKIDNRIGSYENHIPDDVMRRNIQVRKRVVSTSGYFLDGEKPELHYKSGKLKITPEEYGKESIELITLPARQIIYTPMGGKVK